MATLLGRRRGLDDAARAALTTALADPIFELLPLKNLPDQIPFLPRRRTRVGDRLAGQGHRRDARLGGPPPGRWLPGDPAPLRADDPGSGQARRAAGRGRARPA